MNRKIAGIFREIAAHLQMDNVPFKPAAYKKAADVLEVIKEDIGKVYQRGGLKELEALPGIGKNIALKIEEYIKKGKIEYYQKLKKKTPVEMEELIRIEGVGPKTVRTLFRKLDIRTVDDLERAAKEGRIAGLEGFGEKSQSAIIQGIEFLKKTKERVLLGRAMPRAEEVLNHLKKFPEVERIDTAGSLRRMKETIGDIDLLAASDEPEKVMNHFVSIEGIEKVWEMGGTKASVRMKEGFDIDLRVVPVKSYGAALQHFTGSKEHNIALRRVAIDKGMKVNEYGVFQGKKMIAGRSEEEVYFTLGMQFIPPEMREDRGEIALALEGKLPRPIAYGEIKGDLHCHSIWSGGQNPIEEMAQKAIGLGYSYIGIADHTKYLRIENGLDEKELEKQREEIEALNSKFKGFKILQGCEANILKDGSVDIEDRALGKLDFVIAGIHSHYKMEKGEMTKRMIRAMENPHIDIISHPIGRLLGKREGYGIEIDKIIEAAKRTETILEVNAFPERLDLGDLEIRRAVEAGVKLVINSDAHHCAHMDFMRLGIAQARRGWTKKEDIVNSGGPSEFLSSIK